MNARNALALATFIVASLVAIGPMNAQEIDEKSLVRLLTSQHADNFYVDLLSRQSLDQVVIDRLEKPALQGVAVFRCLMVKPGLNEHNFTFYVDGSERTGVLTDSVPELAALISRQQELRFNSAEAERWVADLLVLYKPNFKRFEILKDLVDPKGVAAVAAQISIPRSVVASVADDGRELNATCVVRDGRDVAVKSLVVKAGVGVEIVDLIRVKNVFEWER
jgi:hypothetical protein